jgi:hypothetical protein
VPRTDGKERQDGKVRRKGRKKMWQTKERREGKKSGRDVRKRRRDLNTKREGRKEWLEGKWAFLSSMGNESTYSSTELIRVYSLSSHTETSRFQMGNRDRTSNDRTSKDRTSKD